ncbi:hypothetical protein CC80DRAFT_495402 [Byssothecium circinans]|uniref:Uncharacterized protein n=1 Tax=Byssothecium circinans TaxID=147558 RepID=A0A6A5TTT8_9PLEO|nr:hypothetical protein CC80DRAFT_495402 [Byssothecium circinans]
MAVSLTAILWEITFAAQDAASSAGRSLYIVARGSRILERPSQWSYGRCDGFSHRHDIVEKVRYTARPATRLATLKHKVLRHGLGAYKPTVRMHDHKDRFVLFDKLPDGGLRLH